MSKELEALEIIKETFNFTFTDEDNMLTIDNCYSVSFKDKNKYDLLKEVLKNE